MLSKVVLGQLMNVPKVRHLIKRSVHNYDEIYSKNKQLFQCKCRMRRNID